MNNKQIIIWINRRLKKITIIFCTVAFFTFLGKVTENRLSGNGTQINFLSELVRVATLFSQFVFVAMGLLGVVGLIIYLIIIYMNKK